MSEARELLERFRAELNEVRQFLDDAEAKGTARIYQAIGECVRRALATEPEPGAVPELPEFVQIDAAGDYAIKVGSGHVLTCSSTSISPDDLDVIGDTFHILAARERARRAGS